MRLDSSIVILDDVPWCFTAVLVACWDIYWCFLHVGYFCSSSSFFKIESRQTEQDICQDILDHGIYNDFVPLLDFGLTWDQYKQLMPLIEFSSCLDQLNYELLLTLKEQIEGRHTVLSQLQSVCTVVGRTSRSESKCVNSKVCLFIMKRVMAWPCIFYAFKPCKFHEVVRMSSI